METDHGIADLRREVGILREREAEVNRRLFALEKLADDIAELRDPTPEQRQTIRELALLRRLHQIRDEAAAMERDLRSDPGPDGPCPVIWAGEIQALADVDSAELVDEVIGEIKGGGA